MANSKKRRKVIIFTLIAVVLIALTIMAVFKKREVAITVQTDKVTRRSLTEIVSANGKIQPVMQVVINPEISGEIVELPVKEGQIVRKGDLLLRIKPDTYRAQVEEQQAALSSARAASVTQKAQLAKAEAAYAKALATGNTSLAARRLLDDLPAQDPLKALEELAHVFIPGFA